MTAHVRVGAGSGNTNRQGIERPVVVARGVASCGQDVADPDGQGARQDGDNDKYSPAANGAILTRDCHGGTGWPRRQPKS